MSQFRNNPLSGLWEIIKFGFGAYILFTVLFAGVGVLTGPDTGGSGSTVSGPTNTTVSETADQTVQNPWNKETVVVGIRNQAAPSRNLTGAVAESLNYWEDHPEYGVYSVDFVLRPDAENPDIIVWYNNTINCPQGASGCAHRLNRTTSARPPENVQILYNKSNNYRTVKNTIIHEFGHILGITHCEKPHWVMSYWSGSHGCKNPTFDAPSVENQSLAWRSTNLSVYVDYSNVSKNSLTETKSQVNHAVTYFEEWKAKEVPSDVSFTRVQDPWKADIVITFAQDRCEGEYTVCGDGGTARDFDNDGEFEYLTQATITIESETDVDARGWYVGWGLAHNLAPGNIPPVFEDPSYEEQRSICADVNSTVSGC
ncbi:hypothetical protein GL213_14515 [Halogeometricum borinquense]|nr:hypothetical protein GL213_14515 [Halogeometricum borinquense]